MAAERRPHAVAFFLAPGFALFEYAAASAVFQAANDVGPPRRPAYRLQLVGAAAPAPSSALVGAHALLAEPPPSPAPGRFDTLMVIGGDSSTAAAERPGGLEAEKQWLRRYARAARRIASFPSGTHLLAAAGVLDGAKVTTHWSSLRRLEPFAAVQARADVTRLRDGHIWTCAGAGATVEFTLELVEHDYGSHHAREAACRLLTELRGPEEQGRFRPADPLVPQDPEGNPRGPRAARLAALRGWIERSLGTDLAVPALAARANLSERSLHRAFVAETGAPPGAYVTERRVSAARRLLVSTELPLETIARDCGFGTPRTFQRSFRNVVGMAPHRYRAAFRDRVPAENR